MTISPLDLVALSMKDICETMDYGDTLRFYCDSEGYSEEETNSLLTEVSKMLNIDAIYLGLDEG